VCAGGSGRASQPKERRALSQYDLDAHARAGSSSMGCVSGGQAGLAGEGASAEVGAWATSGIYHAGRGGSRGGGGTEDALGPNLGKGLALGYGMEQARGLKEKEGVEGEGGRQGGKAIGLQNAGKGGEGEGGRDSLGERPLYDGTEEAGFACSAPSSLFDAPTDGSRAVEGEQGCSGEVRGERV